MKFRNYAAATPTGSDAHVDVPLSNIAVEAFSTGEEGLIADQLFPAIPVGKQSDRWYVIDKDAFLRNPNTLRAPGTAANKVEFRVSSDSYFADNYALAGEIPIEVNAAADQQLQLMENEVKLVTGNLRRGVEIRVAGLVTNAANVGSSVSLTGVNKWNNFANSDPIADVTTAHAFIENNTGLQANTMVIDKDTLAIIRRHPVLLDMYKYTSGGQVKMEQLNEAFKVDRILVGRGIVQNALDQGVSSITNIWGNNVLICRVEQPTGLKTRTYGARFNWRDPIYPADFGVLRGRENGAGSKHVDIVEVGHFTTEKVIAQALSYLIASTL